MKICCPKCSANGTVPDHAIPDSGRFISCPRCNEGFTITKPRAGSDSFLSDTCPACAFSTFSEETFSTCPKCGIVIKTFVERQRESQRQKHDQELLGRTFKGAEIIPPAPESASSEASVLVDACHPVNLIGWGVLVAAAVILMFGIKGIVEFDNSTILAQLMVERDEPASKNYVFLHYGLQYWIEVAYGLFAATVSILFMKRHTYGLKAMSSLLWATIFMAPLSFVIGYVNWVLSPIPHTTRGHMIEIFNIFFMSILIVVPLYVLERFIHNRKISVGFDH